MRALTLVTVVMGVAILAGTAVLATLIVQRLGGTPAATARTLDEPQGTRITGIAATGRLFAVTLQGGGPDRVLLLDATLRPMARLTLTH